jgi:hypothetical protein
LGQKHTAEKKDYTFFLGQGPIALPIASYRRETLFSKNKKLFFYYCTQYFHLGVDIGVFHVKCPHNNLTGEKGKLFLAL